MLQAASESPFLDAAIGNATAVLCVLSLPARVLAYDLDMQPQALNDPEKYAIRAAVQVRCCLKLAQWLCAGQLPKHMLTSACDCLAQKAARPLAFHCAVPSAAGIGMLL